MSNFRATLLGVFGAILIFSGCGSPPQNDGGLLARQMQGEAFKETKALLMAGKYEEARKTASRGREELARKHGPSSLPVAILHMLEGDAATHLKDLSGATTEYTRCRVMFESNGVKGGQGYAVLLNRMARVTSSQGDHLRAATHLRKALAMLSKDLGEEHTDVAQYHNELGVELSLLRRDGEAEEHYGKALATWERLHGKDDARVAKALTNLAVLSKTARRYAEAERYHTRAIAIWKKVLGPESDHVGRTLYALGEACFHQKRYGDALFHFRKSLPMQEKSQGKDAPRLAANLYFQGASLVDLARPKEAIPLLERATALRAKVSNPQFFPDPAAIKAVLAKARDKAK